MARITTLQKAGIAVLIVGPVGGMIGTVLSIYQSFAAMETAESGGIGAVGDWLSYALIFSAAGIVGCGVGLLLFIAGSRSKT